MNVNKRDTRAHTNSSSICNYFPKKEVKTQAGYILESRHNILPRKTFVFGTELYYLPSKSLPFDDARIPHIMFAANDGVDCDSVACQSYSVNVPVANASHCK